MGRRKTQAYIACEQRVPFNATFFIAETPIYAVQAATYRHRPRRESSRRNASLITLVAFKFQTRCVLSAWPRRASTGEHSATGSN